MISIRTRTAIALGIVFLMTTKPALAAALPIIGTAIIDGITTTLPTLMKQAQA